MSNEGGAEISVNRMGLEIVRRMIAAANALGLGVTRLPNGTTLVDAGVRAPGSLEAGRLFAEVCLGGLGQVSFCQLDFGGLWFPGVSVSVSDPPVACLASQYAGWAIKDGELFAMGSGPARALYRGEALFEERLEYRDQADVAVLALESRKLPPEDVADKVAERCGVSPENLYLVVAPTASLAGSVQVAARVVETGMHKMVELDFDVSTVRSGFGTCPVAPVASDDLQAIGRTNDAVLYGGRAWYTVQAEDAYIGAVIERFPSSASPDYGVPFYDLFQRYDGDFYAIDSLLFSPAEVCVNSLISGRTFCAGRVNEGVLRDVLLGRPPD